MELFKTTRASMKFDRMILSGSSWLMGVKGQRVIDQAHTVNDQGKKISMWKLHQITGHTGEHLLRPTAKYMKIELTGKKTSKCAKENDEESTKQTRIQGIY